MSRSAAQRVLRKTKNVIKLVQTLRIEALELEEVDPVYMLANEDGTSLKDMADKVATCLLHFYAEIEYFEKKRSAVRKVKCGGKA
jgi:hypothetical protein